MNEHIVEDLTRLRDELLSKAFGADQEVRDLTLAEIVWKINGCLYKGYPRRGVS